MTPYPALIIPWVINRTISFSYCLVLVYQERTVRLTSMFMHLLTEPVCLLDEVPMLSCCDVVCPLIPGLPIQVRDTGLSVKDDVPKSDVNKEYYTQNMEREVPFSTAP